MDKFLGWVNRAVKATFKYTIRYPLATVFTVVLVVLAAIAIFSGADLNVGKLIKWMFGKDKKDEIEVINEIPKDRVDANGVPIPLGTPDDRGFVQPEVKEMKISKNPFRDKTVVKTADGEEITLPVGLRDKDVKEVIRLTPDIVLVRKADNEEIRIKTKKTAKELLGEMP